MCTQGEYQFDLSHIVGPGVIDEGTYPLLLVFSVKMSTLTSFVKRDFCYRLVHQRSLLKRK